MVHKMLKSAYVIIIYNEIYVQRRVKKKTKLKKHN